MAFNFKNILKNAVGNSNKSINDISDDEIERRLFVQFLNVQGWSESDIFLISSSFRQGNNFSTYIFVAGYKGLIKFMEYQVEENGDYVGKRVDGAELKGNIFKKVAEEDLNKLRSDLSEVNFPIIDSKIFRDAVITVAENGNLSSEVMFNSDENEDIDVYYVEVPASDNTSLIYSYHIRSGHVSLEEYNKKDDNEDYRAEIKYTENGSEKYYVTINLKRIDDSEEANKVAEHIWKQLFPYTFG
ncbi:hypothetical protein K5E_11220 [Enterococcus thailandicus]|uniref:hypothetical protein n=1 Tax=Enterococcus thailandicus TaxID=417368 RepID=UPI00244D9380|nr:hypothetical protein [Enterococcus thailandicus]GMC02580.1 hypothetical protein K4E_00900 [Enterococcus thailandicus]GMC08983.1 hypothetical protein K5E_11220 [Enterococcus thailandicus]